MRLELRIAQNYPRVHTQGAGLGKRRLVLYLTSKCFLCTEGALCQPCELPSDCSNKYPEILNYSHLAGVTESWAQGVLGTLNYKSQMAPIPSLLWKKRFFSGGWYTFWEVEIQGHGSQASWCNDVCKALQSALEENSRYFSYCCCSSNSPELREPI